MVANVSAENKVVWRRGRSHHSIYTDGVLVALVESHGISITWAFRGLLKSCTISVGLESVCTMNHQSIVPWRAFVSEAPNRPRALSYGYLTFAIQVSSPKFLIPQAGSRHTHRSQYFRETFGFRSPLTATIPSSVASCRTLSRC